MLLSTQALDQDPSTEAVGPQQCHELRKPARHHHIFMKILLGDLHSMTELKTCADLAPGPTRRGLTILLIAQPLLSRKAPWKQVSFAKMLILGVTSSEPTAV